MTLPRRRAILASLLLLILVFAACAQADVALDEGDDDPAATDGAYVLVEGEGPGGPLVLLDSHRVTLTIDGMQVSGTAACNGYGGTLTAAPPAFGLDEVARTEMACFPEEVMVLENAYLDALARVDTVEPREGGLRLAGPGVDLRFDVLPPLRTADLVDTVWVLDGLIGGLGPEGAISSVAGDEAALELRSDGTVVGGTGCRTFQGEWTESGDSILFTTFGVEGPECPESLREQDEQVVTVLGDGFVPVVNGERLTLTAGDIGLAYHVADG